MKPSCGIVRPALPDSRTLISVEWQRRRLLGSRRTRIVAPCAGRGRATGQQRQVTVPALAGPDAAVAAQALAAKYRIPQGVLVPAFHRLTSRTTVHYELLPPDAA